MFLVFYLRFCRSDGRGQTAPKFTSHLLKVWEIINKYKTVYTMFVFLKVLKYSSELKLQVKELYKLSLGVQVRCKKRRGGGASITVHKFPTCE